MNYDLSHLTAKDQNVVGPIQDDEALFLYALVRMMRLKRVLEIGGLGGYSALNFSKAVGSLGHVYTVDLSAVVKGAENQTVIQKNVRDVVSEDVGSLPLDLVFFDCHAYKAQMVLWNSFRAWGLITDHTVIVLHDTNLHPRFDVGGENAGNTYFPDSRGNEGYIHQKCERKMVNEIHGMGYDAINFHTDLSCHAKEGDCLMRHGLTIMMKFFPLPYE